MATDKKISELPVAAGINASDISVLVNNGVDYQFSISLLLQFLSANLSTGSVVSFGTIIPQNNTGKNGDVFVKTNSGQFIQKVSGSWTVVYTLSATNAADGTVLYGTGNPSLTTGKDLDTYINTVSGVFYLKTSGIWNQVFSMQTGPQGPQGNSGPTGSAGIDGKTILNGITTPSNFIGTDGDYYMNTAVWRLYGPKTAGIWGDGVALFTENSFAVITGSPEDNIALSASLNNKVDKVAGKQLSDENYTSLEKTKLANLSEHYVGYFASLVSLQAAFPIGSPGQYATVDTGAGVDAKQYVWDTNDGNWVLVTGPGNVLSINGQVGAVSLSTDNIGEGSTNKYFTDARVASYSDTHYVKNGGTIQTASININGTIETTSALWVDRIYLATTALSLSNVSQGEIGVTGVKIGSLIPNNNRFISVFTNNVRRWEFGVPGSGETGSNAGSNIGFVRSDDAGIVMDTPFGINRQTGKASFLYSPTIPNGASATDAVNKEQLDLKLDLVGGSMTGDIDYISGGVAGSLNPLAGAGILWRKNTDYAKIYYESTGNTSGDSNLIFEGGDDRTSFGGSTEGVKFRNYEAASNNTIDYFTVNVAAARFMPDVTIGDIAHIGKWAGNPTLARFGHVSWNGLYSSGFMQYSDGSVYTRGLSNNIDAYGGDIIFSAGTASTITERMRIFNNGHVGIGYSTDQGVRLAVNGSILADGEVRVTGGIAPGVTLKITGAAANEKVWNNYASGNVMDFRTLDDASNGGNVWMRAIRTGTVPILVSFYTDVEITAIDRGLIQKSSNGARWRIIVSNTGALGTQAL